MLALPVVEALKEPFPVVKAMSSALRSSYNTDGGLAGDTESTDILAEVIHLAGW